MAERPVIYFPLNYLVITSKLGAEKLPGGVDPKAVLKNAMNPGLGVSKLHAQGITGKGVNVGIIDQPLCQDHPEFAGKIAAYFDAGCGGSESSMHGPAVASLLVGSNCGTAPDAKVYYAAAPSWKRDTAGLGGLAGRSLIAREY